MRYWYSPFEVRRVYRNFFSPISRIGFEASIHPLWSPVRSLNFFAPTDSTRIYIPSVVGKTTIKRALHPRKHKSLCCARPTQNRLHKLTKRRGAGTKFVLFCSCSRLLLLPRLAVGGVQIDLEHFFCYSCQPAHVFWCLIKACLACWGMLCSE